MDKFLLLDDTFHHDYSVKLNNETKLWRFVIRQALDDAALPQTNRQYKCWRKQAKKWFDLKNQDFLTVCMLADLCPLKIFSIANKLT